MTNAVANSLVLVNYKCKKFYNGGPVEKLQHCQTNLYSLKKTQSDRKIELNFEAFNGPTE